MRYVSRLLDAELLKARQHFPAVILTGPRRAGKTTLLRHLLPTASYTLLEDPDLIARAQFDPHAFLDSLRLPAILDEIQHVPELFAHIRARIDRNPRRGMWWLTGSQEAPLMRGVTESMAGRAAVFQLFPFSIRESAKVSLFRGGFPEIIARPPAAEMWFRSYVQTYLERDVRAISSIRDLATFRRFLALVASRCGQILNKTDLAAPLGVSVPTISEWLSILEVTGQILLVPPFYENFGKRLIKSPKLYFTDSGVACHLLGLESLRALNTSAFLGPVFEGFVAAEVAKQRSHTGRAKGLYYFRDQQGLEVDFVVTLPNRRLLLLEAKATTTPRPEMATSIARLAKSITGYQVSGALVHRSASREPEVDALYPGVKAVALARLHEVLT